MSTCTLYLCFSIRNSDCIDSSFTCTLSFSERGSSLKTDSSSPNSNEIHTLIDTLNMSLLFRAEITHWTIWFTDAFNCQALRGLRYRQHFKGLASSTLFHLCQQRTTHPWAHADADPALKHDRLKYFLHKKLRVGDGIHKPRPPRPSPGRCRVAGSAVRGRGLEALTKLLPTGGCRNTALEVQLIGLCYQK